LSNTNLTPLIPLSLRRRGGNKERGFSAPLRCPVILTSLKGEGGSPSKIWKRDTVGELKRGEASLLKLIPLPFIKGKGIKGMELLGELKGER